MHRALQTLAMARSYTIQSLAAVGPSTCSARPAKLMHQSPLLSMPSCHASDRCCPPNTRSRANELRSVYMSTIVGPAGSAMCECPPIGYQRFRQAVHSDRECHTIGILGFFEHKH